MEARCNAARDFAVREALVEGLDEPAHAEVVRARLGVGKHDEVDAALRRMHDRSCIGKDHGVEFACRPITEVRKRTQINLKQACGGVAVVSQGCLTSAESP